MELQIVNDTLPEREPARRENVTSRPVALWTGALVIAGLLALAAIHLQKEKVAPAPSIAQYQPTGSWYDVNRKIADFPDQEDCSAPERAYAAFIRARRAEPNTGYARFSIAGLTEDPPECIPPLTLSLDDLWNGTIMEVQYCAQKLAHVFVKAQGRYGTLLEARTFRWQDGRWLNAGAREFYDLEQARVEFGKDVASLAIREWLAHRPGAANPERRLAQLTRYLQHTGSEPEPFLLSSLAAHQLVVLGEVPHRPRFWALMRWLVSLPEFGRNTGVIYLELPRHAQPLVDHFLAARDYDPAPILEVLRDASWMGCPDERILDFFKGVWEVNAGMSVNHQLRIVLVDAPQPWNNIQTRADWKKYDINRELFMAERILEDQRDHRQDPRHALFIVGFKHAVVNLSLPSGDPVRSAGWHLAHAMGRQNVFTVFSHAPVLSQGGAAAGRVALGLFDEAFERDRNQWVAFPLKNSPFGREVFDAALDLPTTDLFQNAFDGYLYLGRVDVECFSPIIADFYTSEFIGEIERRYRILFGRGLAEGRKLEQVDARHFTDSLKQVWGQRRAAWDERLLGPVHAWRWGGDWEAQETRAKLETWASEVEGIEDRAFDLLYAIQNLDYSRSRESSALLASSPEYRGSTPEWVRWVCDAFQTNPIVGVTFDGISAHETGLPAIPYKLKLRNGGKLTGRLVMNWDPRLQNWYGLEGLEWHLDPVQSVAPPGHDQPERFLSMAPANKPAANANPAEE